MADHVGITGDLNRVRVFQCPHCNQTIDTGAPRCRFCSAPIDKAAAETAASLMERVNQACSDASYLKIALVCGLVFFCMIFLPLMGMVGAVGFYFLLIAVPIWTVRWWLRFGKLKAADADFRRARKTMLWVAVPVAAVLSLWCFDAVMGLFRFPDH